MPLFIPPTFSLASIKPYAASYIHPSNCVTLGTSVNPTNGQATYCPFVVGGPSSLTIQGLVMATVTTPGAANAVARVGLYADDGGGKPGALLIDAGTIDTTAAVNSFEIAAALTLAPGIYWLCVAPQGAPATHATTRTIASGLAAANLTTKTATVETGWLANGVTGALAASPAVSVSNGPFWGMLHAA